MTGIDLAVEPVLAELERSMEGGPRVAAIGGGHGLSRALEAVIQYAGSVTAVVSVADDGGSSGRLSPDLDIPPPGDIRRALVALSPDGSLWRELMSYRFSGADVAGHSLGNLLIAALAELQGGFEDALRTLGGLLGARGVVTPVSATPLTLEAEVGGRVVRGQVTVAQSRGAVSALRVHPAEARATATALDGIAGADQIVLGPGSLYTSLLAAIVVSGIADAINRSTATLVYVCNLTTQDGETLGMTGADHVSALGAIGGIRAPDRVVVHDGPLDVPNGLERIGIEAAPGVVAADVADPGAPWPQHDPARLSGVLRRLVE